MSFHDTAEQAAYKRFYFCNIQDAKVSVDAGCSKLTMYQKGNPGSLYPQNISKYHNKYHKKSTVATLPTLMWPLKLNMKMHWTCPPDLSPIISKSPINIQDSHVLPPLCDSCIQNIGMTRDKSPGLLHTTQWVVYWNLENILSLRLLQTIFNNLGGLIKLPFS